MRNRIVILVTGLILTGCSSSPATHNVVVERAPASASKELETSRRVIEKIKNRLPLGLFQSRSCWVHVGGRPGDLYVEVGNGAHRSRGANDDRTVFRISRYDRSVEEPASGRFLNRTDYIPTHGVDFVNGELALQIRGSRSNLEVSVLASQIQADGSLRPDHSNVCRIEIP